MEVISIGSSSSGNSYIIRAGEKVILLDVGLTAKRIVSALDDAGLCADDVSAVLVTHEHVDHVRSVRAISRKCRNAVFYATRGTIAGTENFAYVPDERMQTVSAGDEISIGDDVTVKVFPISHDAREPVSYAVRCKGEKLAVVTDTGIITEEIFDEIRDADKLVFESNHDEGLLMYGEYPYPVKVRIKSDQGHLSNKYAGEVLARLLAYRNDTTDCADDHPLDIMLAHLSFHNNAPYYARNTIEPILKENGFERDVDYTLSIAAKDETTVF